MQLGAAQSSMVLLGPVNTNGPSD
ncbi:hypothetical protein XHV734_3078 [Xanthomonas hortorum pv. vitians]|nr:hypothetical protein XHV734_3078 [Xanthomonas hortorum pv. vitians]